MRTLSRHLPPAPTPPEISALQIKVMCVCGVLFLASLSFAPIRSEMLDVLFSGGIYAGIMFVLAKIDGKKFEKLMSVRAGENICAFRRAFNLRTVDPWIVRAVYEEVRDLTGDYPIRASDRLVEELRIDGEDVEEIAATVASRAGYDFSDYSTNPLAGKVFTVGDLVVFFTHQRCLR